MSAPKLTIVAYHYVRELARGRYPRIKGLETHLFAEQLEFLLRHYAPVSMAQVMDALDGTVELPRRSVLLTFDDGYVDHYATVFPLLTAKGVPGAFFPPVEAVRDRKALGVNKIHFLLATVPQTASLVADILDFVRREGERFGLLPGPEYQARVMKPGRYDPAETVFVKRMLQRELPEQARGELLGDLFARHFDISEEAFAQELYMTPEQLAHLIRAGMHVGSHGSSHRWLTTLEPAEQASEIDASLEFLRSLGADTDRWSMCYPYGAVDDSLVQAMRSRGCTLGLTTRSGVAVLDEAGRYHLPRLDTNDLPKDRAAAPNQWHAAA